MKSSELAELTGCTVRTLRHYHAIGLLPERRAARTATATTARRTLRACCASGDSRRWDSRSNVSGA